VCDLVGGELAMFTLAVNNFKRAGLARHRLSNRLDSIHRPLLRVA
jgi:hypothetical protein